MRATVVTGSVVRHGKQGFLRHQAAMMFTARKVEQLGGRVVSAYQIVAVNKNEPIRLPTRHQLHGRVALHACIEVA